MVRPDETSSDPGPLHVSLPVLRGYATVLDDVSRDLGGCEALASSYCVDADFGKIVEDLTSDYATLLPQLQELLAENETVMAQYALAIDRTASDFAHTDDGVASRFQGDGINAGSGTTSFTVSSVGSSTPYAPEGELPEVSFGFLFDRLARAIETFVGWDVRGAVTDWIAGDVQGLSTQASCWEIIGERLDVPRGKPHLPVDHEFVVTESDQEIMQVELDWPTPDDLDLEVYRKNADGSLTEVGSSGNFVGDKEKATINAPTRAPTSCG